VAEFLLMVEGIGAWLLFCTVVVFTWFGLSMFWHYVEEGQKTARSIAINVMPVCYSVAFIFLAVASWYEGRYLYNHHRIILWVVGGVSAIIISKWWGIYLKWSAKNPTPHSDW